MVRPYTRTKRGKLERVKGYTGRPKTFTAKDFVTTYTTPLAKRDVISMSLNEISKKNNLRDIQLETYKQDFFGWRRPDVPLFELNRRYHMVFTELDRLSKKIKIDGRGKLAIEVKKLKGKNAVFRVDKIIIELGLKAGESLAHEYSHFLFGQIVGSQKERKLEGAIDKFLTPIWELGSDEDWKKGCLSGLTEFTKKFSETETEEEKPFVELISNIINYFAVNPGLRQKKFLFSPSIYDARTVSGKPWMEYIFSPTEMVARAISTYVTGKTKSRPPLGKLETTDEYKKICDDWGKKYLETGLVKSDIEGGV